MYTDEFFELYKRYEMHVHKKERDKSQLERFLCNSPLYDPFKEPEKANAPSVFNSKDIDKKYHTFKDEGVYPDALGTYHFYHRIDGKLISVGVVDITKRFFNSAYFIYDPEYMFLSMGVVGAIREIEYCNFIKKNYNPDLVFYQLGEMVSCCPKVNYKLNYQPGMIICPRTKKDLMWDDVKDATKVFEGLSSTEKAALPFV